MAYVGGDGPPCADSWLWHEAPQGELLRTSLDLHKDGYPNALEALITLAPIASASSLNREEQPHVWS